MYTLGKWRLGAVSAALLSIALLTGCGDDTSKEEPKKEPAVEETAGTEKEDAKSGEDALPTRAELEKKYEGRTIEYPMIELVDKVEKTVVEEVISGDTIKVTGENGTETVKLAGVTSPDMTLPDGSRDQYHGYEAKEFMEQLEGYDAFLERVGERDGQTLGHLWVRNKEPNHIQFDRLVLEAGMGIVNETDANKDYIEELRESEAKAKAEKKGVWSRDGYVTEDGYDSSIIPTN